MKLASLVVRYALFAGIAMLVNLAIQRVVMVAGKDLVWFALAVGSGTVGGLLTKFVLDKFWIFDDRAADTVLQHGQQFTRYAFMGLFTTAIFWGSETAFWLIGKTEFLREVGAVLGLTVGYFIKYQLDARFVFKRTTLAAASE